MEDIRQSEAYARYIKAIGWKVERIGGVNVFIRGLGIAKIQRADVPANFPKIPGVWMTKIEPLNNAQCSMLKAQGFRQDGWPLLASRTIRVDLDNIKPKKDARYCIRKALMLNAKCSMDDFDGFYDLWRQAAKIKHLWVPPKWQFEALTKSFGKNALCITIDDLAGAVVLMHAKTAYYYYAAALPEGKRLQLPYAVVWELMKEAKKRGCKTWDFEGIYDSRWPNKSIKGYSHFKKSFGGEEVDFPGSFTRWF